MRISRRIPWAFLMFLAGLTWCAIKVLQGIRWMEKKVRPEVCTDCAGSGFSGYGTGYDDVCSRCGGRGEEPR